MGLKSLPETILQQFHIATLYSCSLSFTRIIDILLVNPSICNQKLMKHSTILNPVPQQSTFDIFIHTSYSVRLLNSSYPWKCLSQLWTIKMFMKSEVLRLITFHSVSMLLCDSKHNTIDHVSHDV